VCGTSRYPRLILNNALPLPCNLSPIQRTLECSGHGGLKQAFAIYRVPVRHTSPLPRDQVTTARLHITRHAIYSVRSSIAEAPTPAAAEDDSHGGHWLRARLLSDISGPRFTLRPAFWLPHHVVRAKTLLHR